MWQLQYIIRVQRNYKTFNMVVTVWVCRTVAIKNLGCTSEWTKVEYTSIHKWCLQVYITARVVLQRTQRAGVVVQYGQRWRCHIHHGTMPNENKPHVNMAKPLDLSKSTKSDWIEGASMTEMQWTPWDSAIGYINHTCPQHDCHNDP